jgi:uncharacterized membrane protein YqaE (UPF0057 family)
MKKIFIPITLLALVAIVFSSCSNSSKLAFTKRHYRSGYFVDHIPKTNTSANPSDARATLKTNYPSSVATITKSASPIGVYKPAVASQKSALLEKAVIQTKVKLHNPLVVNTTSTGQNILLIDAKAASYSNNEEEHEHHVVVDADVSFVVVVLCAIFIPPLGVALAYGIDSYFWIDLILTLLFFFPGMIFALIVVLM